MEKLPIKDVIEIFESKELGVDIAAQYGVNSSTVSDIKRGLSNVNRMAASEPYQDILKERLTLRYHQRDREGYMRSMVHDIDRGFIKSVIHSRSQIEGLETKISQCEGIINKLRGEL